MQAAKFWPRFIGGLILVALVLLVLERPLIAVALGLLVFQLFISNEARTRNAQLRKIRPNRKTDRTFPMLVGLAVGIGMFWFIREDLVSHGFEDLASPGYIAVQDLWVLAPIALIELLTLWRIKPDKKS